MQLPTHRFQNRRNQTDYFDTNVRSCYSLIQTTRMRYLLTTTIVFLNFVYNMGLPMIEETGDLNVSRPADPIPIQDVRISESGSSLDVNESDVDEVPGTGSGEEHLLNHQPIVVILNPNRRGINSDKNDNRFDRSQLERISEATDQEWEGERRKKKETEEGDEFDDSSNFKEISGTRDYRLTHTTHRKKRPEGDRTRHQDDREDLDDFEPDDEFDHQNRGGSRRQKEKQNPSGVWKEDRRGMNDEHKDHMVGANRVNNDKNIPRNRMKDQMRNKHSNHRLDENEEDDYSWRRKVGGMEGGGGSSGYEYEDNDDDKDDRSTNEKYNRNVNKKKKHPSDSDYERDRVGGKEDVTYPDQGEWKSSPKKSSSGIHVGHGHWDKMWETHGRPIDSQSN